jgi:hypothetical protein
MIFFTVLELTYLPIEALSITINEISETTSISDNKNYLESAATMMPSEKRKLRVVVPCICRLRRSIPSGKVGGKLFFENGGGSIPKTSIKTSSAPSGGQK